MSSFLGCFGVLFPTNARARAAILDYDDEDLHQLIETVSSSELSSVTSRGGTATSASSFRGLGSLSGKAIMGVGNLVIKGVERVDIQVKLRRIATQLGRDDCKISPAAMADMFEFQRAGLYPKKVRRRAMQLVVLVMSRRRTYEQLLQGLLQQPLDEICLFLEQLCCLKFSNEKLIPRLIQISDEDCMVYQEKRQSSLTDRFCDLVLSVMSRHPRILLDSVDSGPLFEVVLHAIKTDRTEDLVLSEWEEANAEEFIRKLNWFRMRDWTSNVRIEEYPFLSAAIRNDSRKASACGPATDAFCDIISDVVESKPGLLSQAFPLKQRTEVLDLLFERRHFTSIISSLLASNSEDVRWCLLVLARPRQRQGSREPGGFSIDVFDEREVIARAERQSNFSDVLRRIQEWHPHFLHEVFNLEQFTALIITAVDDPNIQPNWTHTHLLLYHFAKRGSLSPLRSCFVRFVEAARG
ncbi:hypothetical protein EIP91_006042 [Steccherinum ochraceum]|uniref:Uncharacterized protein n=1 Tax=Steccherinum ochraceum TaxID=92696 RepID=A0A4R0RC82_9APHY|nr:hypothetical protein EIP91_006042 [Steccherinum ochraceum]